MFGLVVSPAYVPDRAEIERLHPTFVRSIIYRVADVERVTALGVPALITVNNECAEVRGDWSGWDSALREIVALRAKPFAVCVGNEFDLWWQDNPADVPPVFAAGLVKRAAAILRPAGIAVAATAVAGRTWQDYLAQMAALCRDDADYFDLHAYGQRPDGWGQPGWGFGDLRVALSRARELTGRPVIMSEYGVKIGDASGEGAVAELMQAADRTLRALGPDVCPLAAWFAWRDEIGAPAERGQAAFGLLEERTGRRRPAWQAFANINAQGGTVPTHQHIVGEGVLAEMARRSDSPASCEQYENGPHNTVAEFSRTFGRSGRQYVYVFDTGRVNVYPPEAA
jgi:hypothetical protein